MPEALLALGSNIGDRERTLDRAVELLRETPGIDVLRVSRWHESAPVGGPSGQGMYLNGAARIHTSLTPAALLAAFQAIEGRLGRERSVAWGPRTIDLDLLLYDTLELDTPELQVPHPRMAWRRFVLAPAAEIAPDMQHPVNGLTISAMLARAQSAPQVVTTIPQLREHIQAARKAALRIGLVPTMGALHEGHASLVDRARRECAFTVATIFVNPTQFGPNEDYARYPRTLDRDVALLAERGIDVVFKPQREEMYPTGHRTFVEVQDVTDRWEGAARPGHFRGVATIVLKLFNAAQPDVAYFGQKDFQQCVVVRRLTSDLNLPIEIRVCPTVRDADGLALSSRNVYLSTDERSRALSLSQSLKQAARLFTGGEREAARIIREMKRLLAAAPVEVDYAAIVDPETLEPLERVGPGSVALIAARVGSTRLIDNHIFE
jgi:pantoate--beta-alanine ligase